MLFIILKQNKQLKLVIHFLDIIPKNQYPKLSNSNYFWVNNFIIYCQPFIMQKTQIFDCIVLGAGIAGIGAARYLKSIGLSYIVLEAQNDIGGRVKSINIRGVQVDKGAYELPGFIQGNPVYQFIKNQNLALSEHIGKGQTVYIDCQNGQFSKQVVKKVQRYLEQIHQQYGSLQQQAKQVAAKQSFGHYIKPYLQKARKEFSESQFRLLNLLINMIEHQDAGSIDELSCLTFGFDQQEHMQMDQYPSPKGTYAKLVNKMGQNLNIVLQQQVIKVSYGQDLCLISTKDKEYSAKSVICCLPLGVLKKEAVQFSPQLPQFNRQFIQNMGFGNFNKVILAFKQPFWDKNVARIKFASEQRGKFSHFLNVSQNGNHILCCFVSDNFCRKINQMSDQQIIQEAVNFLKAAIKDKQICLLQGYYTRWEANKFQLGGYPHITPNVQICDIVKMRAEGVSNKIWFAGDYLYLQNCGTAHGACITGIKAAKNVQKQLIKQKDQ